jgi:3-oxoacyl-[acyl-carrier-protein] synthase II
LSNAPWFPSNQDLRREASFVTFATTAAAEALQDAQWAPQSEEDRQATGVAIGAGMSCTTDMAEAGALLKDGKLRRLSPFFVPKTLVNMAAGAVSMAFGFKGPNHAVSTACASGAHGIGDAFRMVQRGDAAVMVAGGTEACIDAVALGGFSRLKALSTNYNVDPTKASRPFDKERDGFVLGEGAGILILEELEHAHARHARIYAEIRGYGMSSDAYHITQPPPDGAGAALAMRRALAVAGVAPSEIAYINAHATSTPIGDDVEQRAIASVFLNEESVGSNGASYCPAVSSTKGAVGHLLGAAGAVEAAFTVLASYHRLAPPNCNLVNPDPGLLHGLVVGKEAIELKDAERRPAVLSNSFGFGGTNASLVFGPPPS